MVQTKILKTKTVKGFDLEISNFDKLYYLKVYQKDYTVYARVFVRKEDALLLFKKAYDTINEGKSLGVLDE